MTKPPDKHVVIPFPSPRRKPGKRAAGVPDLGLTPQSKSLGPMATSPKGHWCDHCKGIWYSHLGEAHCPVCGKTS